MMRLQFLHCWSYAAVQESVLLESERLWNLIAMQFLLTSPRRAFIVDSRFLIVSASL